MRVPNYFIRKLIDHRSDKSLSFKLRKKRAERIIVLIDECYNRNKEVNIIDIGGTSKYWKIIPDDFLMEKKVSITIVNLPSPEPLPQDDMIFTYRYGDGCNLSEFGDKSFDIAHSNSVIEHVGNRENVVNFSKEMKRISKKYYLQTPNYWFPIEPHFATPFFHWLPEAVKIKLLLHFNLGWYNKAKSLNEAREIADSCRLLSKKDLVNLFPEGRIFRERILFFVKSFVVINY
jgi:hypothetical protein